MEGASRFWQYRSLTIEYCFLSILSRPRLILPFALVRLNRGLRSGYGGQVKFILIHGLIFIKANGGCLGNKSRGRTQSAAIHVGEEPNIL